MRARPSAWPALSRRAVLLAALLAASCASEQPAPVTGTFPPLDYSYLLPLRLNVASIEIEQRYVPQGVPPDVSPLDPVQPAAALRLMAEQRLKAEGASGRAVFIINDASLLRQGDLITGTMAVELDILTSEGAPQGYARATVTRQLAGAEGDLSAALYQFTRQMMDQMNVEFEYQVRHNLSAWLLPEGAVPAPVQATPLPPSGASLAPPPPQNMAPQNMAPPNIAPQNIAPQNIAPQNIAPPAPMPFSPPGPGAPIPLAPPPAAD